MTRIRSIHPGFWSNHKTISTSAYGRLLFLGLGNLADDAGIFEWHPKAIKLQILPNDRVNITALLCELMEKNWIATYYVEGVQYGRIHNFYCWQSPKSPVYKYPDEQGCFPPENASISRLKSHKSTTNASQEHPCVENPILIKAVAENFTLGEERKGVQRTDSLSIINKMYLPEHWSPSEQDVTYAKTLGLSFSELLDDFCHHWRQKKHEHDPKGKKSDWSLTWRQWCRRSKIWQQHVEAPSLRRKRDPAPAKNKRNNLSWMVDQFGLSKEKNNG